MNTGKPTTQFYKRSHFVTHLPENYLYAPSHFWLRQESENIYQVGITKFASRMLGEMVDHAVEAPEGKIISPGDVLGWIEGFKALSDLYSVMGGKFLNANPELKTNVLLISKDCYEAGWIYRAEGKPDPLVMNVDKYKELLDVTIDRILEKEKHEEE
jgi:glycine cleavage system H protein